MNQIQPKSRDGSIHVTDERINTITSLVGSMLSVFMSLLIGYAVLVTDYSWYRKAAVLIYCAGLLNLFVMSTLHHGLRAGRRAEAVFRTLDYTAIFWLIAGTVSALVAIGIPTTNGSLVVAGTWVLAALGIALRSSLPLLDKHVTNTLFIALGWLPATVLLLLEFSRLSAFELLLLAGGGLIYSIGFVVYVTERPNIRPGFFGFHELWHIFVLFAAHLHAALIYLMLQ